MNYPIWELTTIGGGSLIALIAVLHVYIAHLAVGGGMFLWLTDRKGYRENNAQIHEYVHKHTWFFLLLTMVFGGVTGVGIWFIISLVSPAATSTLIHNFVFGWAIEWVFFLGEITALLVYYYYFEKLTRKQRLNIAFLYALFAWLSLFIINGILSFMMTPGTWLETGNFWDGFLNPTFIPSLLFRSFAAVMIAGLFGFVTTVFLKESEFRKHMVRYSTKWLLYPVAGLVLTGIWYYYKIPLDLRTTAFGINPQSVPFISLFIVTTVLIFLAGIFFVLRTSPAVQKVVTFVLLIIGLGWMGSFEYLREFSRMPYVIADFMYANSIPVKDIPELNANGILKDSKWVTVHAVTSENQIQAGKEIFNIQCLSCHTVDGIRNDIIPQTRKATYLGVMAQLTGMGKVLTYMPHFVGSPPEMEAVAAYIAGDLHGKAITDELEPYHIKQVPNDIPAFDIEKAKYVLLVWNDLGMHCISDSDPWFVILPPANTLEAQLIRRGEVPALVSENVELVYRVEKGFEDPAARVPFWNFAEANFGVKLKKNIGLHGNGVDGKMKFNPDRNSFIAETIPVVPYPDDGSFLPYPIFTIEARDTATGEVLASTQAVTPVSTEMGCRNCHGGGWRVNGVAGIDSETSTEILKVHDRINNTNLYEMAMKGQPRLCQSCHADPALGAEGKPGIMNFSAAMHGWHANYMPVAGGKACILCHPAFSQGRTRCSRGIHGANEMTCDHCHGTIQDHALALLKGQEQHPAAVRLMANLEPNQVATKAEINPRTPWVNEPDCITCHRDFKQPPQNARAYNTWNSEFSGLYRIRTDNAGIRCEGCHGSTHAEYPAVNPFGVNRDNMQPLQYTGLPYPIGSNFGCQTCHMKKMTYAIHHPNMERMFRNVEMAQID